MRKKIFLTCFMALCLTPYGIMAQTLIQGLVEKVGSPSDFEGEITVVSMQTSTGSNLGDRLSYDGKHIDKKWFKNGNMHLLDTRMHIHYIANYAENRCIIYSDETKSGVEYPLDKKPEILPENIAAIDSRITAIGMTVDKECVYDKKSTSILNTNCEASKYIYLSHYNSALANGASGLGEVTVETWESSDSKYKEMIMKQTMDLKYSFKAITTSKTTIYFTASVSEIKEQSVSDNEFEAPSDYEITKVRTFFTAQKKLKDIFKETEKRLMKKKQHPSQLEDNEIFETEGEWEE